MKYHINEAIVINKSADIVQAFLSDMQNWNQWSPWICLDDNAKTDLSKSDSFRFKRLSWEGRFIGSGHIEIVKETESEIHLGLTFLTPFKTQAYAIFYIKNIDTHKCMLTWTMTSSLPLFFIFFVKFFKKMISQDFQRGLLRLKTFLEKGVLNVRIQYHEKPENVSAFLFSGLVSTNVSQKQIGADMSRAIHIVAAEFKSANINPIKCYAFYMKIRFVKDLFTYISGFEHANKIHSTSLTTLHIPQHKAVKVTLTGAYDFLPDAWASMMAHVRGLRLKANKKIKPYEKYIITPNETQNVDEYVTEIYFPFR